MPPMRRLISALPLAVTALAAAGCGYDPTVSSASPTAAQPAAETQASTSGAPRGTTVKVVRSQYGRVVADRRGEALYLFDKEKARRSECYGACAKAWPPLLTKAKPR